MFLALSISLALFFASRYNLIDGARESVSLVTPHSVRAANMLFENSISGIELAVWPNSKRPHKSDLKERDFKP